MTPINVLLVDDHRFVATVLESMLASVPDVTLHWCEQATDALAKANALAPDVILQDLVMPGIDGFTLVRRYRENAATARIPIIVLSGNDDAGTRAQAKAAGADDFMVKLPSKERLLTALRQHAARHQNAEAPSQLPSLAQPASGVATEFIESLFNQFFVEATSRVATLRSAAERHDADTLRRTAHSLRGSSSIVGAQRLAALCADIENGPLAVSNELSTSAAIATIDAELSRVRQAVIESRGGTK